MSTSRPTPQPATYPVTGNAFGWPLVVLSLLQLMVVLDGTVVNLALAKIQFELHLSDQGRSWVIIAYTLAYGGLLLLGGRLGDAFGRKRVFLVGVGLFTLASLVCGLASSEPLLLAARVIQGSGAAIASPTAMALIVVTFAPGATRAQAFSTFGAMTGIGSVLGLVIGGILTEISWRWIFLINVPFGVLIILIGAKALALAPVTEKLRLDIRGAVLITAGSTLLVFGMTTASTDILAGALFIAAACCILFVFIRSQQGLPHAIIPLTLFSHRARRAVFACLVISGGLMMAMTVQVALFVQEVLQYSPLRAGIAFLPFAAAMVVGFGLAGWLAQRYSPQWIVCSGAVVLACGFVYSSTLDMAAAYWPDLLLPILIIGVGVGIVIIPLTLSVVAGATSQQAGPLSALSLVSQTVGGPIGLALVTAVASRISLHTLKAHAGEGARIPVDHVAVDDLTRHALGEGYTSSLLVCAGLSLIIAVTAALWIRYTPQQLAEGKQLQEPH